MCVCCVSVCMCTVCVRVSVCVCVCSSRSQSVPPVHVTGPYFVDCISERVEENHFVVKVITMDEDWDGLTPDDRAGSKVLYSITGQTRAVSGCICVCA